MGGDQLPGPVGQRGVGWWLQEIIPPLMTSLMGECNVKELCCITFGAVDPHLLPADSDPTFYLNADPDPDFYLNSDPDPAFYLNADPGHALKTL